MTKNTKRNYVDNIAEENGKYYIKFSVHGQQVQKLAHGATNRTEAKAILDAERFRIRQIQGGILNDHKKKKYSLNYLNERMLKYSSDKGKKSFGKDKYQMKELVKYFTKKGFGCDIAEIKQKDIIQLQIDLKNTLDKNGKKRENSTVNKYLACLKTAFNILVKDEEVDISSNPCIGVNFLPEDNRRDTYLPEELSEEFLSLLPEMARDIVELDLATGLRIGNVMHARKCEFNLFRNEWRIPKNKNKGKKEITIGLNKKAQNIVKKYYEVSTDYLFFKPHLRSQLTAFHEAFAKAAEKIGVPDLQPKDIRRTVGTWLYHKGVSLRVIKDILHHSNVATTERYLGITGKEISEAYDLLDN